MKKIIPRAFTIKEFEKWIDESERIRELYKDNTVKYVFMCSKWVAENIYKLDLETNEVGVGTLLDLFNKTQKLTEKSEIEEIKNSKASGNGE